MNEQKCPKLWFDPFDLSDAGFPLDAASAGKAEWARYFQGNPGSQNQALNVLLDTSRTIDANYGTQITQGIWQNVMQGNYTPRP